MTRKETKKIDTGGMLGGQFYKEPYKKGKAYSDSLSKASSIKSKFFRNFNRSKTKAYMTTTADIHYLTVIKNTLGAIYTAGDPQTAFDGLIDISWEVGAKTGNIKDIDATQEANFKTWMENWTWIAWEVAAQAMLRPFVPAFTESSITPSTVATIAIWNQADWDAFITSLEKLDCPDFIYRFMKPWLFIIKMTEGYEKAGVPIPPSYCIPICHNNDLDELATRREAAKAVMGNAMTHCKKFGIPFSKFSMSQLAPRDILGYSGFSNDMDAVAIFNHHKFSYYNNDPAIANFTPYTAFTGANRIADFTAAEFFFDDKQEMSMMHAFAQCFSGTYDVANCLYGEIFSRISVAAAEYEVNILHTSLLGTSWTPGTVTSVASIHIMRLFGAWYNIGATAGMMFTGSKVTAAQTVDIEDWFINSVNPNMCTGTGVGADEQDDSCVNAAKYCLYGE